MKNLRFLSITTILVIVLVAIAGVASVSAQSVCSPATPISVPFSKDGPGTFCYQASSVCNAINSWSMTSLLVNGTNYTNMWVSGPLIAPLNGGYTITYNSTVQFSHFEITGPCPAPNPTATRTRTPTPGPSLTITRTSTQSLTPTVTLTRTITPTTTGTLGSMGWLGYGTVNGKVTDAITGAPIAGALVTCNHGGGFSPLSERCTGTRTTGADGTYLFDHVLFYSTDTISMQADAAGHGSIGFVSQSLFTTPNLTVNFAMPLLPTVTRTPTPGPSLTPTITLTRTITPTPSRTLVGGICAPVETTIELLPFAANGVGTHCWRIASFGFINSNNTGLISINGVNFTNLFATPGGMPTQIDGYWYITYVGNFAWSHFEIQP